MADQKARWGLRERGLIRRGGEIIETAVELQSALTRTCVAAMSKSGQEDGHRHSGGHRRLAKRGGER